MRVNWEEAGSDVLAFTVITLTLELLAGRRELTSRVVGAAVIVGLMPMIFDMFV